MIRQAGSADLKKWQAAQEIVDCAAIGQQNKEEVFLFFLSQN